MKLQSMSDPRAMQMLNSMSVELGALETATGRIRAQMDSLMALLSTEEVAECEDIGAEEARSIVAEDEVQAGADISHTDDGVIVLCARIEASVAEFAAAAEVVHESEASDIAAEALAGCVVCAVEEQPGQAEVAVVDDPEAPTEVQIEAAAGGDATSETLAVAEISEVIGEAEVNEAVASAEQVEVEPIAVAAEGAEALQSAVPAAVLAPEIEAVPLPAAANINVTDSGAEDPVASIAGDAAAVSNVVPLKLKRRVWPQLMTACASVLLIAAAGIVVAMPELVWIYI